MRDLTGKVFTRLTVKKLVEIKRYESAKNKQTKAYYLTICECGKEKVVRGEHLTQGKIKSCGCLNIETTKKANTKHGMTNTSEHKSWLAMKRRILNPDELHRKYYKDIGITDRWIGKDGFINFISDMGVKPTPKHEIDRVNNNGNYEPSNCKWSTRTEQMNNTRRQYA